MATVTVDKHAQTCDNSRNYGGIVCKHGCDDSWLGVFTSKVGDGRNMVVSMHDHVKTRMFTSNCTVVDRGPYACLDRHGHNHCLYFWDLSLIITAMFTHSVTIALTHYLCTSHDLFISVNFSIYLKQFSCTISPSPCLIISLSFIFVLFYVWTGTWCTCPVICLFHSS
jgi:hypothetical protein